MSCLRPDTAESVAQQEQRGPRTKQASRTVARQRCSSFGRWKKEAPAAFQVCMQLTFVESLSCLNCLGVQAVLKVLFSHVFRSRLQVLGPLLCRSEPCTLSTMAPKAKGGTGNKPAQDYVAGLWARLASEQEVRAQLKADGYKAGRITQLIKATRPAEGQAGPGVAAAAAPKRMARPAAAAEQVAAAKKRPAEASSSLLNRENVEAARAEQHKTRL